MTLILIQGNEVRLYEAKDMEQARYWFDRRIEKEGWEAEEAFLVDDAAKLPLKEWARDYEAKQIKHIREAEEAHDRAEFERLKKKFGP